MKTKTTLKTILITAIVIILSININAQSFTENFDNITLLTGNGWSLQNNSSPTGTTSWFQGTSVAGGGPFDSYNGAANAYIGANYNNTGNTGDISNWLITPNITIRNGDVIAFYTRKANPDAYADRLQVRMSTNGASTNVGAGAAGVGDFTTLLLDINPTLILGVYPTSWTLYTITVSGLSAPTSGRFAFRYFVTNGGYSGANSDYIGIDNVVYTAYVCPTLTLFPSSISDQTAGVAYNQTITNTGALGAATYDVTSGALPTGLTLSSAGVLSGTPTATGSYSFTITITDASGCSGSQSYTVNIVCPPNSATIPTYSAQCSNGAILNLTGGLPAGGVYSGTGVSGTSFDPSSGTQTVTYTYTDTYGCVNTASSSITVNNAPTVIANASTNPICAGSMETLNGGGASTYTWNNSALDNTAFVINSTTNYTVTGTDNNGCSNTASVNVVVKPQSSSSNTYIVCAGGSVTVGSSTYTTTGTYTDIFTGANGCDSTATTHLTVRNPITKTQSPTVCAGGSITVGNNTYTTSGTYTDVLTGASMAGCDSTVTTNLTVMNAITGTQAMGFCPV